MTDKPAGTCKLPTYDVVIVGAGIAGALLAKELALRGRTVLILEAGDEIKPNNNEYMRRFYLAASKVPESPYPPEMVVASGKRPLPMTEGQRTDVALRNPANINVGRPSVLQITPRAWHDPDKKGWKWVKGKGARCDPYNPDRSYLVQKGPLPFASTYERVAGGTARHWLGISLRHLPNDFVMREKYTAFTDNGKQTAWQNWPKGCRYDDLLPWYDRAEREIGVAGDATVQHEFEKHFGGHSSYGYPMPAIPLSFGDKVLNQKLHQNPVEFNGVKLEVTSIPSARNSEPFNRRRACAGNTNCIPVCPIQAKYDPTITLRDALNTGKVTILYHTVVNDIVIDDKDMKSTSNKVTRVDFIRYHASEETQDRRPNTATVRGCATGKHYVLAANAIETPRLMLMSNGGRGITGTPPDKGGCPVGCYLMDHPLYIAGAMVTEQEQVFPYRGPQVTGGLEVVRDGEFRKQHASFRADVSNTGWNLLDHGRVPTLVEDLVMGRNQSGENCTKRKLAGAELIQAINHTVTRQVGFSFLVEQTPDRGNCVGLSQHYKDGLDLQRPEIHYNLSQYTKDGLGQARKLASRLFKTLGWREVTDGPTPEQGCHEVGEGEQRHADNQDKLSFCWTDPDTQEPVTIHYMGAGHIAGTCRMGERLEEDSVVDKDLTSWHHRNLSILGSSVFPTLGTANPTLTIAALSLRLGEHLDQILPPGTSS